MNRMKLSKIASLTLSTLLISGLVVAAGCRKSDDEPRHRNIKGRVTGIDTSTDQVRMLCSNEKGEKEISGTLSPDAEILINGRTARLDEVMIGDKVDVTGRIEKHDGEKKLVALKVYVSRPETSEPSSAPAPASATTRSGR